MVNQGYLKKIFKYFVKYCYVFKISSEHFERKLL